MRWRNARQADPNARIAFEERRIVNGREILALQLTGTTKGISFKYFGYYYGATSGTVQVVTYTTESTFAANVRDFTDFLNGLEVSAKATPAVPQRGTLTFNSGMSIQYDQAKWQQTASKEAGRFTFNHSSGDGYAVIIAEKISIPLDTLPDVALSNAKDADPNAKVVFKEKRNVNGHDVWFLKIDASVSGIAVRYYGYYYSRKGGTVQVLMYTGQNLIPEYDHDFMEFLNGLSATE